MRVRAKDGDAVFAARKHVGCACGARHVARAGNSHTAVGTLGTAQTKLSHGTPLSSSDHTRGLCGRKRLEADRVEQRRLKQLALKGRSGHTHHGFARKHEVALGNRIDIHVGAKSPQVLEKRRVEHTSARGRKKRRQVVDILIGKAQVLYQIGQVGGAAHNGIGAAKRLVAIKRRKAVAFLKLAVFPQALSHRELVKVGKHRHIGRAGNICQRHGISNDRG